MSNAPVFRRDQYSDLYGSSMLPVLEELFRFELQQHPSLRQSLFKIVQTERDIWQSTELHDLDLFKQIPEGAEYSFVRGAQGAHKTFSPVKYGLGFSISEEAIDDGKFDMVADQLQKLAKSARESQEISAINVLNNAFSTETVADGVSICNSAHPLPSGGTYRNVLSTAADLSVSSLDTMLSDFETQFVGDTGIIYRLMPKILLVHPDDKRYAKELIGSDLKADTADNNINSFKQDGLMVLSSPHLTDVNAWFMMADPADTGMRIIERSGIETKAASPDVGFSSDSMLWKARYREDLGAIHGYGIFGTAGV